MFVHKLLTAEPTNLKYSKRKYFFKLYSTPTRRGGIITVFITLIFSQFQLLSY